MRRDRLRNHGPRIVDQLTLRGFEALVLENSLLRATILPEMGSDIVELRYKPLDLDVLWRTPNGFWTLEKVYPSDLASRTSFLDYYPGGWQEILPNGGTASEYAGASFVEHGEVSLLPWSWQIVADEPDRVAVKLTARTLRAPLLIEKTISLGTQAALLIDETLTNLGAVPFDLMWGHHPAFGAPFLDVDCVIDVPPCRGLVHPIERYASQRLVPNQTFTWPLAPGRDGSMVDMSRVQPPGAGTGDLLFLTDLPEGWCAITNQRQRVSVGMAWTRDVFPHLWYWHEANGAPGYPWYGQGYVLALEPWSSYPGMGIAEAITRGTHMTLGPGEQRSVHLTAALGTGHTRVSRVSLDGEIVGSD
jgi:hypothetical protein